MATFEPGHLHIEHHALNEDDYSFKLSIHYEVSQDPEEGMLFKMHGSVEDKELKEEFFLPKDQAFDFARHATRIAQKYGLPKDASIGSVHKEYDLMFEDIRARLDVKSGDPVKPEHLE
jgi:hypothetical protein